VKINKEKTAPHQFLDVIKFKMDNKTNNEPVLVLSTQEVLKALKISRSTLKRLRERGVILPLSIFKQNSRYAFADVLELLKNKRNK